MEAQAAWVGEHGLRWQGDGIGVRRAVAEEGLRHRLHAKGQNDAVPFDAVAADPKPLRGNPHPDFRVLPVERNRSEALFPRAGDQLRQSELHQMVRQFRLQPRNHLLQFGIGLAGKGDPLAQDVDPRLLRPVVVDIDPGSRLPIAPQAKRYGGAHLGGGGRGFLPDNLADILRADIRLHRHAQLDDIALARQPDRPAGYLANNAAADAGNDLRLLKAHRTGHRLASLALAGLLVLQTDGEFRRRNAGILLPVDREQAFRHLRIHQPLQIGHRRRHRDGDPRQRLGHLGWRRDPGRGRVHRAVTARRKHEQRDARSHCPQSSQLHLFPMPPFFPVWREVWREFGRRGRGIVQAMVADSVMAAASSGRVTALMCVPGISR